MIDDFLYKYRFYIGGGLIVVILAGLGVIGYNKYQSINVNKENQAIAQLKQENQNLRNQLSGQSQQVAGAATSDVAVAGKININSADATELDKIPGIGPARAADIINYRETHGGFKSIEEMKNIKGIGDKTFESMKDLITTGE
jgi:competence protein ComEA